MDQNLHWPGWEIVRRIGSGSFGTVYEIQREVYGDTEKAALKVITIPHNEDEIDFLRSAGLDNASITQTFQQQAKDIAKEYKLMAQMRDNPNVVHCDDFRDIPHDDGLGWDIYIKMELLTPLMKCLDKVKTEEQIICLGKDICNALIACQQKNILHRDIKPQNIFVSESGQFKLGDFGIARTVEKTTQATAGIGTYSYMAPEVEKGQPYGKSADIYSLGLILYWLLNERRGPFFPMPPIVPNHSDWEQARFRRFSGEPIPAPLNGSPELQSIVLKACAFDPKERYQTAHQLLDALNGLKAGIVPPAADALNDSNAWLNAYAATANTVPATPADEQTVGVFGQAPTPKQKTAPEPAEPEKTVGAFWQPAAQEAPVAQAEIPQPAEPEHTVGVGSSQTTRQAPPKNSGKKGLFIGIGTGLAVLVIILLLLLRACGPAQDISTNPSTESSAAPSLQMDWSQWQDSLPDSVTADAYDIEEQTLYRSRKLENTTSSQNSMSGWELYDTISAGAGFGLWSDWSEQSVTASDTREVETQTRYRYREKQTTTGSSATMSGWTLYDTTYTTGDYGDWSSWSATAASASDSRQVETKTQYRYRDKSTTTSSSASLSGWTQYDSTTTYGDWSDWGNTDIFVSGTTTEVQTQRVKTGTNYFIGHYCTHYYSSCPYQVSWTNNTTDSAFNSECTYHNLGWFTSLADFKLHGEEDGKTTYTYYPNGSRYTCENGCIAWFILEQEDVYKTQYRSRSVYTTYSFYQWSDWSSYSDTAVTASSTREVETRTVYRYRDKTQIPTYHFERWGSWSDWSADKVSANDTRQVETTPYYRYRDQAVNTTYYFRRWTDWSDFAPDVLTPSETTEVETKTQYRYRPKQ